VSKSSLARAARATKLPGRSRRPFSDSTRRRLVEVATELFTESGYAATSLDSIVAGAEVTKGALYHHFTGKADLFEAVFEEVEAEASSQIVRAVKDAKDPWSKANDGLSAFLEVVQSPAYRRIVRQDGPAVLGYTRFRERERSTYSTVGDIVRSVLDRPGWDLDEHMLDTFTTIFFGAMSAAGDKVAEEEDPAQESQRVETAIGFIMGGLRGAIEAGAPKPEA
jgi:AcrR family transcriptional regulator